MAGKVILVAGARPNFMKLAPVYKSFCEIGLDCIVVHTGQHYDYEMSQVFFDELGIPKPDENLGVGSNTHASQTAEIMMSFEKICEKYEPRMVVVFGDVNSTIACALVARKIGILVSHVEAGLRSGDMEMPEEINRILTDHISHFLFTTSEIAVENLQHEGISEEQIFFVGNVMIDTLKGQLSKIKASRVIQDMDLENGDYDLLTLHRPSNVDNSEVFTRILKNFENPKFDKKIIFPAHPRTKSRIEKMGLSTLLESAGIAIIPPLGYHDFLSLISNARSVWTDSGGIQEETSSLGVPCLTIRENTERPETILLGTNMLVDFSSDDSFYSQFIEHISRDFPSDEIDLWDGKASERIATIISKVMAESL